MFQAFSVPQPHRLVFHRKKRAGPKEVQESAGAESLSEKV